MASVAICLLWLLLFAPTVSSASQHHHGSSTAKDDSDSLVVHIVTDGSYTISVRNNTWLRSLPTFFNADGVTYQAFHNLKLNATMYSQGTDAFGKFVLTNFQYYAGNSEVGASIKTYQEWPFILFSQVYLNGANNTRADNVNYAVSGFPAFQVQGFETEHGIGGYMAYGGMMCGDTDKSFGVFSETNFKPVCGLAGGPIALFDGSGDTLIISPASNFMAASSWCADDPVTDTRSLYYGLMGGVTSVPADTTVQFIVFYSSAGVNKAFEEWGRYLQLAYGRTEDYVRNDLTINYLGYWTDNGAYYYYNTEKNQTYETTMLDAKAYSDQMKIPYRYWQYDSWWYYKGVGSGVKTWTSRPDIFPDGFETVYKKMGSLPSTAHNRMWASDATYAKVNGGNYNFIVEPIMAIPDDQQFWDDLLLNSSAWGLHTYEQDWLNKQFAGTEALLSDVNLGGRWLNQMASAAVKANMTVQYCMSNSRHIMQALQNSVVTQARASDDYSPGDDQWKIGVSSIFAYAMGIAPYKDTFWSTTTQPYNPYSRSEPHNELELVVSVLSTGPVGPSDMIGHTNVSLLMRCCNADGLILKPSKPATAIDAQIYQKALSSVNARPVGPDGEVWSTYSRVTDIDFGIIFVPEINTPYIITPSNAALNSTGKTLMVFEAHNLTTLKPFSEDSPLQLDGSVCNRSHPCIYHVTPLLKQQPPVYLLGEVDKLVPVSTQRIIALDVSDDITLLLKGAANERVPFIFSVDSRLETIVCTIGSSGVAHLSLNSRSC